jgi:hypothetical protein
VKTGAETAVAVNVHGSWKTIVPGAIAVAGNVAGYVVVQPGNYVATDVEAIEFSPVPTGDAILMNGGTTKVLGIEGSQLAWVS